MKTPLTLECDVHFGRQARGAKVLQEGQKPAGPALEPGRVPRIARLLALAHRFEQLIRAGEVHDYAELARLGHVTRARVTQVMNLLLLAPDIQEQILFLPRIEQGRDPIRMRQVLPIAAMLDWKKQRPHWRRLNSRPTESLL